MSSKLIAIPDRGCLPKKRKIASTFEVRHEEETKQESVSLLSPSIADNYVNDIEFAVLDFETTGLSTSIHRVIEIAAAIISATPPAPAPAPAPQPDATPDATPIAEPFLRSFSSLCAPNPDNIDETTVPSFISELTGITSSMLVGQPSTGSAIHNLLEFVGPDMLFIAHNAAFDAKFFKAECARIDPDAGQAKRRFLCTLKLARKVLPGLPKYSLTHLKEYTKYIPPEGALQAHRALSDVVATVHLFRYLMARIKEDMSTQGGAGAGAGENDPMASPLVRDSILKL